MSTKLWKYKCFKQLMLIPELFNIFTNLSILSVLLPLLVSFRFFPVMNGYKVLVPYFFVSVLSEFVSAYLVRKSITNHFVNNIFSVLEFICLAILYHRKFEQNKIKQAIAIATFLFVLASVYQFGILGKLFEADNIISTFESGFFIVLGYTYVYRIFADENIKELSEDSFTWINFGVLTYCSATFVLFLFHNFIVKFPLNYFYAVHGFHLAANIAFHVLLALGIWKIKRNSSSTLLLR